MTKYQVYFAKPPIILYIRLLPWLYLNIDLNTEHVVFGQNALVALLFTKSLVAERNKKEMLMENSHM